MDNQSLESTVILNHGDKVYEGSSSGPLATRSRVSATAAAAIQALKKFFGPNISISLIEYQRQAIGGTDCYTVALSWSDGVRESIRYGIAPLCGPESEVKAIVRAILSAVNRAVSFVKTEVPDLSQGICGHLSARLSSVVKAAWNDRLVKRSGTTCLNSGGAESYVGGCSR